MFDENPDAGALLVSIFGKSEAETIWSQYNKETDFLKILQFINATYKNDGADRKYIAKVMTEFFELLKDSPMHEIYLSRFPSILDYCNNNHAVALSIIDAMVKTHKIEHGDPALEELIVWNRGIFCGEFLRKFVFLSHPRALPEAAINDLERVQAYVNTLSKKMGIWIAAPHANLHLVDSGGLQSDFLSRAFSERAYAILKALLTNNIAQAVLLRDEHLHSLRSQERNSEVSWLTQTFAEFLATESKSWIAYLKREDKHGNLFDKNIDLDSIPKQHSVELEKLQKLTEFYIEAYLILPLDKFESSNQIEPLIVQLVSLKYKQWSLQGIGRRLNSLNEEETDFHLLTEQRPVLLQTLSNEIERIDKVVSSIESSLQNGSIEGATLTIERSNQIDDNEIALNEIKDIDKFLELSYSVELFTQSLWSLANPFLSATHKRAIDLRNKNIATDATSVSSNLKEELDDLESRLSPSEKIKIDVLSAVQYLNANRQRDVQQLMADDQNLSGEGQSILHRLIRMDRLQRTIDQKKRLAAADENDDIDEKNNQKDTLQASMELHDDLKITIDTLLSNVDDNLRVEVESRRKAWRIIEEKHSNALQSIPNLDVARKIIWGEQIQAMLIERQNQLEQLLVDTQNKESANTSYISKPKLAEDKERLDEIHTAILEVTIPIKAYLEKQINNIQNLLKAQTLNLSKTEKILDAQLLGVIHVRQRLELADLLDQSKIFEEYKKKQLAFIKSISDLGIEPDSFSDDYEKFLSDMQRITFLSRLHLNPIEEVTFPIEEQQFEQDKAHVSDCLSHYADLVKKQDELTTSVIKPLNRLKQYKLPLAGLVKELQKLPKVVPGIEEALKSSHAVLAEIENCNQSGLDFLRDISNVSSPARSMNDHINNLGKRFSKILEEAKVEQKNLQSLRSTSLEILSEGKYQTTWQLDERLNELTQAISVQDTASGNSTALREAHQILDQLLFYALNPNKLIFDVNKERSIRKHSGYIQRIMESRRLDAVAEEVSKHASADDIELTQRIRNIKDWSSGLLPPPYIVNTYSQSILSIQKKKAVALFLRVARCQLSTREHLNTIITQTTPDIIENMETRAGILQGVISNKKHTHEHISMILDKINDNEFDPSLCSRLLTEVLRWKLTSGQITQVLTKNLTPQHVSNILSRDLTSVQLTNLLRKVNIEMVLNRKELERIFLLAERNRSFNEEHRNYIDRSFNEERRNQTENVLSVETSPNKYFIGDNLKPRTKIQRAKRNIRKKMKEWLPESIAPQVKTQYERTPDVPLEQLPAKSRELYVKLRELNLEQLDVHWAPQESFRIPKNTVFLEWQGSDPIRDPQSLLFLDVKRGTIIRTIPDRLGTEITERLRQAIKAKIKKTDDVAQTSNPTSINKVNLMQHSARLCAIHQAIDVVARSTPPREINTRGRARG